MIHPEKPPAFVSFMHIFPIIAVLAFTGCAGEPVPVELPINHPANPEAYETHFTPPSNPFRTDVADMAKEPQTGTDTMMEHKMPESSGSQHGGHKMEGDNDKENRPVPETTIIPDHREGKHLRKEGRGQ